MSGIPEISKQTRLAIGGGLIVIALSVLLFGGVILYDAVYGMSVFFAPFAIFSATIFPFGVLVFYVGLEKAYLERQRYNQKKEVNNDG